MAYTAITSLWYWLNRIGVGGKIQDIPLTHEIRKAKGPQARICQQWILGADNSSRYQGV